MASAVPAKSDHDNASSAASALAKASQLLSGNNGDNGYVSNGLDHLRSLLEKTEVQAARAVRCTEMRSSTEVPLRDELAQARCEAAMWRLRAQAAQGECSVARVSEASLQRRLEHLECSSPIRGMIGRATSSTEVSLSAIDVDTWQSKQQQQIAQEVAQLRQQLCAKDMELDAAKAAHVLSRTEAEARHVWIKQQAQMELSAHAALIAAERSVYERRLTELETNAERAREEIRRQAKDAAAAFGEMQAGFAMMLNEAHIISDEHRNVLRKLVDLSRTKVIAYCGQPIETNNVCPSVVTETVVLPPQPTNTIGTQRGPNLAPAVVEPAPRALSPPPQMRRAVSPMPVRQVVQASQVQVGPYAISQYGGMPCSVVSTATPQMYS